jgi:hypothetical protein
VRALSGKKNKSAKMIQTPVVTPKYSVQSMEMPRNAANNIVSPPLDFFSI